VLISTVASSCILGELLVTKTVEDLKNAFAGESQANRRYLAFAQKADEEGYMQAAKLFRAAAEAETVHALNHLRTAGEVKSTVENLKAAVEGETFEFRKMYVEYFADAKKEDHKQAAWSLGVAGRVEQIHAGFFSRMYEALEKGKEMPVTEYYVCSVCGNTVENEAPGKCPVCGNPKTKFFRVT